MKFFISTTVEKLRNFLFRYPSPTDLQKQENTEQPQTGMIRNLPSSTDLQNMASPFNLSCLTNQTLQSNNFEMGNPTNSLAFDHTRNSTSDIESQIPSASREEDDEAAINQRKKNLIKLVEPMTYFCGGAVIGGIGFNATMVDQKHHKTLLWIITLLLFCDFVILLSIRILVHNISTRLTSLLGILEKLVYLALGILVLALCTGVMGVK